MAEETSLDEALEMLDGASETPEQTKLAPSPAPALPAADDGDSLEDFMAGAGVSVEKTVPAIWKPWMKHHEFKLVRTIAELDAIVDAAIAAGRCALDLECEGLDNRIFYHADGTPYTKHQIVGFCLSYDGHTGYYAPVRHKPDDGEGTKLNLPVELAEAAIRRLCLAAQPKPDPSDEDPLSFRKFAEPPKLVIYFWNAKFDQEFLYPITGIDWWHPESFEDGNLAYFTKYSDDKALSLKDKALQDLRDPDGNAYEMIKLKDLFIQGRREIKFALLSPDEEGCIRYACSDAICTYLLCTSPRPHEKRENAVAVVKEKYNFTYRLEKQTAEAIRWMERPRVRVTKGRVIKIQEQNAKKRDETYEKITALARAKGFPNFEPGSSKQLSEFLFGQNGLDIRLPVDTQDWPGGKPQKNEKSGQYKTDADTLERLLEEHPSPPEILKWIVDWRGYEKLDGTYLQNMVNNVDANSEMRFQFKQTGAATGRFSAPAGDPEQGHSGIPIHGIPATSALRQAFEARDGYTLVKADYAGEELRIAANVSNEDIWIKEFNEGDGDLHSITARAFFNKQEVTKDERKMGKIANFALLYGGGPAAIMRATGCDKLEASRRKQAFDKAVPTFAKWIKGQHAYVRKYKGVWTALGRWIAIPHIDDPDKGVQAACERKSTNFPIQGTGADVMKIALVLLCKAFYKRKWLKQGGGDDSVRMLLTVHDEIVFEIKHERVTEAVEVIVACMAKPAFMAQPPHSPKWKVPLIVEPLVGPNWGAGYKVEAYDKNKPLHDGDVVVGGFVYGTTREIEKDADIADGEIVVKRENKGGKNVITVTMPEIPWLKGVHTAKPPEEPPSNGGSEPPPSNGETVSQPSATASVERLSVSAPTPTPPKPKEEVLGAPVVVLKIRILGKRSVAQVRAAVATALDPDVGKLLCLMDGVSGRELISPTEGIRVVPEQLSRILTDWNLSDGRVYPYVGVQASS